MAAHLKIAHVHTRMLGGGGDRVSELESVSLSKRGHAVTVVGSMTHDISARLVNAGVRTIKATPAECRVGDLKAATGPLDVVHCHCMLSAPFAAELASATASVLVLHNHSVGEEWWECHRAVSKFRRARRVRRKLIDRAAAQASRIICVSPTVLGHMRAIGLPTENAVLIPNPVPDAYFSSPISEDDYSYDVCTLARASRAKRPLSVLRILSLAARRAPGLRPVWVGDLGRWARLLRSTAALLGVHNMHFTGSVPPGDVPALLDRSRVLLSASGREGHPLSVLEALARGCTVLLSDIPAHRGFSGIHGVHLYPLRDEAAAAESLVHLVQEHVRVPRSWMVHDYSVEAHASKIERLYLEAIADRRLA